MAYIEISGVQKTYASGSGEVIALRDVSLLIERGEFVSIIGPSGCGKSTLLRIIDGLIPLDAGQVSLGGNAVVRPGPDRAMVFQHFALLPWGTVLDNVAFPLEAQGVPKSKRRQLARDLLGLVGLEGFENFYPAALSGGMQQRVGLARALVARPDVLLMDEPFGALDALTRTFMQDELLKLWARDEKTVIFVTHSIDEAVYLSDKVVVMTPRPGRVAEVLTSTLGRPRTDRVREDPRFVEMVGHIRRHLARLMTNDPGSHSSIGAE